MNPKKLNCIKDNVEALLTEYPELRDDDLKLAFAYWEHYDNIVNCVGSNIFLHVSQEMLSSRVTNPESIRRVRQKIQQEGRCLGTKKLKRQEAAEEVAEWARG